MSEFEDLVAKLLEQRPDLNRQAVNDMIGEKKAKVGRGYLTDQGALFLIASEMGIAIGESLSKQVGLKNLHVGATDVSLETRVLSISEPRKLSRKDGTSFFLRTMTVYDNDATASVKMWDEKANLPGVEALKPGDLVKIIKAYVKADLSGKPAINIGSGSSVEPADGQSDIRTIESLAVDVGTIKDEQPGDLVVTGIVDGQIGSIQFTNSRGQPGKGLKMRLRGSDDSFMRIVVWGKDEKDLPAMIPPGARARLIGARTKMTNQGLEIHGNEATAVEVDGSGDVEPVTARIISSTKTESGRTLILAADKSRSLLRITDEASVAGSYGAGDTIECMPSRMCGSSISLDAGSYARKTEDSDSLPKREELRTKIGEIAAADRQYCIEAIIVRKPDRRQIQTKSGESVALSEMLVGDDTDEIWVKGWRSQASLIDKCVLGQKVSITDAGARAGLEGKIELSLSAFSAVSEIP